MAAGTGDDPHGNHHQVATRGEGEPTDRVHPQCGRCHHCPTAEAARTRDLSQGHAPSASRPCSRSSSSGGGTSRRSRSDDATEVENRAPIYAMTSQGTQFTGAMSRTEAGLLTGWYVNPVVSLGSRAHPRIVAPSAALLNRRHLYRADPKADDRSHATPLPGCSILSVAESQCDQCPRRVRTAPRPLRESAPARCSRITSGRSRCEPEVCLLRQIRTYTRITPSPRVDDRPTLPSRKGRPVGTVESTKSPLLRGSPGSTPGRGPVWLCPLLSWGNAGGGSYRHEGQDPTRPRGSGVLRHST